MPGFDLHTLDVLEYPKIKSILRGLCLTPYGQNRVDEIAPLFDIEIIRCKLDEAAQMRDIVRFGEAFPLSQMDDITASITKSKTPGIFLDPSEMLKIKDLLEITDDLSQYRRDDRANFPRISDYLNRLKTYPEIIKHISKTIDRDGSIFDDASARLKQLRMDIFDTKRKIVNRLEHILADRHKSPGWQDDTITQRDGRYVIPIVAGQFRADSGIIHDRSQSGATLFVEPSETVELNNKLGLNLQDERLEIDRILREITAKIGAVAEPLAVNCEIIGVLDAIHAAALLAVKTDSLRPRINSGAVLDIRFARHPLLMYYSKDRSAVIPNDISLGNGRLAIIVTGPNTGGKTVLLKTVGLMVLMVQSGLLVPADESSEFGLFGNIFADIGDEQSIELSLSTFSSHIRQIIFAVRNATERTLILLDEIGAGTDPKEGAALAESVLQKLVALKSKVIVTTHYSQLKTLPMLHPEMENASFEFDRKTLKPTFRLLTGIPGASYAVEIAHRLGMPDDIADNATRLLGKGERSLTGLIESMESELTILKKDKVALEEKLKNAGQLEDFYHQQVNKLKEEADSARKAHLQELDSLLNSTRIEVERLVKEIRESKASQETVRQTHTFLKESRTKVDKLKSKYTPKSPPTETLQPGDTVAIESLRKEGEFVEMIGGDRARVRIGNILMTLNISDLKKITDFKTTPAVNSNIGMRDLTAPGPEIHLRGMTVEEAREALDKFLDSALMTGLKQIYVVHGKGTGTLRKTMTEFLKKHPAVDSLRLGNWNEGGAGVTVVTLK